jgi:parallel beta-helix repeat protein
MKFWVFLVLAFVVLLSSCQIFFLAGVYEELQDRGIVSGGTENIPNTSSSNVTTNTSSSIVYIYVSRSGNDANDGLSPSKPVRTLVRAMEVANNIDSASNVLIKVGSGVYTNGDGLSNNVGFVINRPNLIISGGWDSSFSSVEGKSELDGNGSLYHVVMIRNVTNVKLENLVIRGGNANGSSYPDSIGGGIYVSNVSYLVIENNVVISNNSAQYGGGLYLYNSTYNTISGSVYSNSANDRGGGLYLDNSTSNTISGSVYDNSANYYGGGLYLWYSSNNTISGSVYGNSANYYGGGLYLDNSSNNTISGSVYGNSAGFDGGGVYLVNSDYFTNTGWITNNTASSAGGGVYRIGSYDNSYFGNVSNNSPDDIAGYIAP